MRVNRWFYLAVLLCAPAAWAAPAQADEPALQALIEGARASDSDTMMIVRDGQVLVDYRKPGATTGGIEMMSATKSLVGLGVGRLLMQRRIESIDQPVSDFYPEWKQGQKAKITLRMLLDHTSGLQNVANTTVEIYPAPDGFKLALAAELSDPPGTRFAYNNKAMNLLAGIIEQASGMRMDKYLEQELLMPMGITDGSWNADGFDKAGHPYAMAGWNSTAAAAIKVGQLVLDEGRWKGRPLISVDYIREMVGQSQPYMRAYGLLWWRRPASETFCVDADAVAQFERAGVDKALLEKLKPMLGRRFDDGRAFKAALQDSMGSALATLAGDAKARGLSVESLVGSDESSPIVAYEANGYHGQYIVVVPKARLVAVRQVGERPGTSEDAPWPFGYGDFTQRVIALARTMAPVLDVTADQGPLTPRR